MHIRLAITASFLFVALLFISVNAWSQPQNDKFLQELLAANNDTIFRNVLANPNQYRLQVIYTRIDRNRNNKPSFRHYYFNHDPGLYFNPASMVKLPLALLSLEKLNQLNITGVDKHTTLLIDSSAAWQTAMHKDPTSPDGLPSVAQYIRRMLLVSENDPYNRLYQFVGQQQINRGLHQKGHRRSRITRQFMGLSTFQNRHTNAARFIDKAGNVIYSQQPAYNTDSFDFTKEYKVGKAHINSRDSLVNAPFDFTHHNFTPLRELQQMLQSVLFHESTPPRKRFQLTSDDRAFMLRYLSQYPSETPAPLYDTTAYYDSYVKFFFRDNTRRMPPGVRVFNKVGWSYGFMT
ncbi:MAG: hypothetical protein K0Q66_929, partial [Chitinophagaceae bacterium]|nr:hypothetical protein [Chitinophagaceae bacterium]